jgi:hypothetical protein
LPRRIPKAFKILLGLLGAGLAIDAGLAIGQFVLIGASIPLGAGAKLAAQCFIGLGLLFLAFRRDR